MDNPNGRQAIKEAFRAFDRKELAEKLGISDAMMIQYALGHKRPSPLRAKMIEQATKGAITRVFLRPDIFGDD